MRSRSIALRGPALAVIGGALIAAGPAAAQRGQAGGGYNSGYSSMQNTAPTTSPKMYNTSSRESQMIGQVKDPATTLASAIVEDSSGDTVGQVKSVNTTADGKASAVNVSLSAANGPGRVVSIGANSLMYDSDSKRLKASLTQSQIESLPPTQSP